MPLPVPRLNLRQVYAQAFAILGKDFLPLMALALFVRGPGILGEAWVRGQMSAEIAAHQPAAILPWLVGFIPFALADGGIVWFALRRLSGGKAGRGVSSRRTVPAASWSPPQPHAPAVRSAGRCRRPGPGLQAVVW